VLEAAEKKRQLIYDKYVKYANSRFSGGRWGASVPETSSSFHLFSRKQMLVLMLLLMLLLLVAPEVSKLRRPLQILRRPCHVLRRGR
jgi:hypothetical protein